MAHRKKVARKPRSLLVVDDAKNPKVTLTLKPGMKLNVTSVSLVDAKLKRPAKIAARLCGGTGTCLALIDVGQG